MREIKSLFLAIFITDTLLFSGENKLFNNFLNRYYDRISNFAWKEKEKTLIFSIYKRDKNKDNSDKDILNVIKNNDGNISLDFNQNIYNSDEDKIIGLIKTKKIENVTPKIFLSNGITEKNPNPIKKICEDNYLGSMGISSLKYSDLNRCIYSAPYSHTKASINIYDDNLLLATAHFALRVVLTSTIGEGFKIPKEFIIAREEILNNKNISNPKMREFLFDCLILSMFDIGSYQSSLRKNNGSTCDVKNEWYILSYNETKEYLKKYNIIDYIDDNMNGRDSFIYTFLNKNINSISSVSNNVLKAAQNIYKQTFQIRKKLIIKFPKYQLNTIDCGFWQLKKALIENGMNDIFENFKINLDKLKNKVRKEAFELGFV